MRKYRKRVNGGDQTAVPLTGEFRRESHQPEDNRIDIRFCGFREVDVIFRRRVFTHLSVGTKTPG